MFYELKVKFINENKPRKRIEIYSRLCEVTDRMAVLFFQKGSSISLEVKQIEGGTYEQL